MKNFVKFFIRFLADPVSKRGCVDQIAACVILFDPDFDELSQNIKTFEVAVRKIYLFCNSFISTSQMNNLVRRHQKEIVWLGSTCNVGVGKALNDCSNIALNEGFRWLLMMDQDSRFVNETVQFDTLDSGFGLYYPRYILGGKVDVPVPPWLMTSGTLLNLTLWSELGEFQEKYFIDGIDFEYCMRLLENRISMGSVDLELKHNLGNDLVYRSFMGVRFRVTNHEADRYYYIFRNYLSVIRVYVRRMPGKSLYILWVLFLRLIRVFLFESNKLLKFKSALLGVYDFQRRQYGKVMRNE